MCIYLCIYTENLIIIAASVEINTTKNIFTKCKTFFFTFSDRVLPLQKRIVALNFVVNFDSEPRSSRAKCRAYACTCTNVHVRFAYVKYDIITIYFMSTRVIWASRYTRVPRAQAKSCTISGLLGIYPVVLSVFFHNSLDAFPFFHRMIYLLTNHIFKANSRYALRKGP